RAGRCGSRHRTALSMGFGGVWAEWRSAGHGHFTGRTGCRYGNGGNGQDFADRSIVRALSYMRAVLAASIALLCGLLPGADDEGGKILRPADNSSHVNGQIDLVATAPS